MWVWSLCWEGFLEKVFLPEKSHGQRNLVGYSPWGCKESDTTEWLSVRAETHTQILAGKFLSVQFSHSVMSNPLRLQGLQHASVPSPSPTPRACSDTYPWSQWCHPAISSSVIPFSSCLQSCPATGSFRMSQFFPLGGQSIGASASASVLPMNIQDQFPLGLTDLISLQSKGLWRAVSNTTV